jgi:hypothetical protein
MNCKIAYLLVGKSSNCSDDRYSYYSKDETNKNWYMLNLQKGRKEVGMLRIPHSEELGSKLCVRDALCVSE